MFTFVAVFSALQTIKAVCYLACLALDANPEALTKGVVAFRIFQSACFATWGICLLYAA
jgi:hypothetical protein